MAKSSGCTGKAAGRAKPAARMPEPMLPGSPSEPLRARLRPDMNSLH